MSQELRFDGRVAIVTGAGNGLGRSHALLLASRGAQVVVNDLGGGIHGEGKSQNAADKVVDEITAAGGKAVADYHSVEDGAAIVKTALDAFGRLDILVNNAGILRDVTFAKMSPEDWELVYRVHVLGAFRVTHAAWPHMREQKYGRIVMTASAAGIYGNFGQANYSMAKLGLVGLSNTLALEGRKSNVHVNTIAPIAGSRLTETVLPKELLDALRPEFVSPLLAWLCHESCEDTGGLYEVGGGFMAKLRWQRAAGKTFRLGRTITPEAVQQSWKEVSGFEKSENPGDITSSMAPIMTNIQAGPSRGGNQFIDVDRALGYQFPPFETSYDERDLSLYALGVGAAEDPLDDVELPLVYEMHPKGFKALPTYAVIPAVNSILTMAREGRMAPGLSFGLDRLLHGEQYTRITRPLPPKAKLSHKTRVKNIYDKGKNAVLVYETRSFDESGEEIMVNELTSVIRGAGGWGGERGPSDPENVPPSRPPDATAKQQIHANQALLYRLSGDWNPLHVDPSFAKAFGFAKPILHGLCSFGYAARHVIRAFAGGDPRTFKSIKVRFADSVLPGETLVTEMWKESDTRILFQCKVAERDKVVISNAAIELYSEIPAAKAKPAAAASAPAAAAVTVPTSADIFAAIGRYVRENADAVNRVGVVYQFALSDPASVWTVDLKNGAGGVTQGEGAASECKLELSDADFMAMCTGQADPQKLYFGGKLKITGNVMASQKLTFLQKIDPERARKAVAKARASGAPAPATAAAAASTRAAAAPALMDKLASRIKANPGWAKEVSAVIGLVVTGPDGQWVIDLKNGAGAVKPGSGPVDCTLTLSDQDLVALVQGKTQVRALYQTGKLRVDGDVRVAQRLDFFKTLAA
jgi:3-hydroxyacyl-CoA dehydrogenase/3a,7a,12a-trihydroxy-5b-cholest-24-enoyl-CoA hydratase